MYDRTLGLCSIVTQAHVLDTGRSACPPRSADRHQRMYLDHYAAPFAHHGGDGHRHRYADEDTHIHPHPATHGNALSHPYFHANVAAHRHAYIDADITSQAYCRDQVQFCTRGSRLRSSGACPISQHGNHRRGTG